MNRSSLRHAASLAGLLALALALGACRDPRERKVRDGVAYAKHLFEKVNTDPLAGATFTSNIDIGGGLMTWLTANAAGPESFGGSIEADRPSKPWTVVVSAGKRDGEVIIEGFGEDLDTPLVRESVILRPIEPR